MSIHNITHDHIDGNTRTYTPPLYSDSAQMMIPAENPEEIHGSDEGHFIHITPGFIQLLPKLTERKAIADSFFKLKNKSVAYLPSDDIDMHFQTQDGFDSYDSSVEFLLLRRNKDPEIINDNIDEHDNRSNVFAGYTSLPGGVSNYGESSLDAVVRHTYEQTGIDLTDHEKYCMVAQSAKHYLMRYLPNKRRVISTPFLFVQLVPGRFPEPKISTNPDAITG